MADIPVEFRLDQKRGYLILSPLLLVTLIVMQYAQVGTCMITATIRSHRGKIKKYKASRCGLSLQ